jgi:phosphoenolpyruvate carboxykinase (ATP)
MQPSSALRSHLSHLGLDDLGEVHYNLPHAALIEQAVCRGEGQLSAHGALVVSTGAHTGRSPKDRFVVDEPGTTETVGWGAINRPVSERVFDGLLAKMQQFAQGKELFVVDAFAGSDERYRLPVRVVAQKAWHGAFARNMFRPEADGTDPQHTGEPRQPFTVLDLCEFEADGEVDGVRSGAFVIVHLSRRLVIIGGTHYSGEIKKSVFSALNYLLPDHGVLPMHCSANTSDGTTAVFFGLSGTGKTTLSADASRTLIGDDEHGWSDHGVYNFEGGCYAKTIRLSAEGEPEIFATTRRFGSIIENTRLDDQRVPDFEDDSVTENLRVSYPLAFIPNASEDSQAGHPDHVIFLTADAFGVLPPISCLSPEQAQYHFLSGYTAKVAGTEAGVKEPQATFSACFGEPFMVRPPQDYARMLAERMKQTGARCWLVNTGWTGGPYGTGHRIPLEHTRAMVNAILRGDLNDVPTTPDPFFGLNVPKSVPGVPDELLSPRATWADKDAYDKQAHELFEMFTNNFKKFEGEVSEEVARAAPEDGVEV